MAELRQSLDAFGDDFHAHVFRERNNGANNLDVVGGLSDAADERAIDFQSVHREPMQVTERRIAGTEIIDAQLHAQRLQTSQELHGRLSIIHDRAFGNFQF